jgi:hypothetical protein
MSCARVGKVLALVSPAPAVGVGCFMLFATGHSQVSMEERAGSEGDPVEAASDSGWMSAYEYSLENSHYVYFLWSGFIVVICLLAAGAALRGWVGLVWACAGLLGVQA